MFGLVKVPRSVWIVILADLTSLLYQIQIKENRWVSWLPPAPWKTVVHIPPRRQASSRATVAIPQVWDSHTGTLEISSLDTRVLKKLKRIHMLAASLLSSEKTEVLYKHGLKLRQTDFKYQRMLWSQGSGEDYQITKVKHVGRSGPECILKRLLLWINE